MEIGIVWPGDSILEGVAEGAFASRSSHHFAI